MFISLIFIALSLADFIGLIPELDRAQPSSGKMFPISTYGPLFFASEFTVFSPK